MAVLFMAFYIELPFMSFQTMRKQNDFTLLVNNLILPGVNKVKNESVNHAFSKYPPVHGFHTCMNVFGKFSWNLNKGVNASPTYDFIQTLRGHRFRTCSIKFEISSWHLKKVINGTCDHGFI